MESKEESLRQELIVPARRVLLKVGSGVLTGKNGLDTRAVGRLAAQIAAIRNKGREVVLVSSGAIASGFKKIGLTEKPKTIPGQQACAALGQAGLMRAWEKSFARQGLMAAQILLTADDLAHRRRYLNARNTLVKLLEWGIIPVINENDTVVVAEIKFGDNDTLASMLAGLIEADLFINLTDIDGLYDCDPRDNPQACFLPLVENVGQKVEAMASRIPGALGSGGMYTKVRAARRAARLGIPSIIANGRKNSNLEKIMQGRSVGTLFLPRTHKLKGRKPWIAFAAKPRGRIVVDDGAVRALRDRGKSLLPSGVLSFEDRFQLGDIVEVRSAEGARVAVGLTNYSSEELAKIAGRHSREIEALLGYRHSDEVIHRDNLVVLEDQAI